MAPTKNNISFGEILTNVENQKNSVLIKECLSTPKLLLKAFKEKDQSTIQAILSIDQDSIIRVAQRLPHAFIEELIEQMGKCLHENVITNGSVSLWLKYLLKMNSTYLMSQPNIQELLIPIADLTEQRIAFQNSLRGLQGNINFFLSQIQKRSDVIENEEILIPDGEDVDESCNEEISMYESPNEELSDEEDDI